MTYKNKQMWVERFLGVTVAVLSSYYIFPLGKLPFFFGVLCNILTGVAAVAVLMFWRGVDEGVKGRVKQVLCGLVVVALYAWLVPYGVLWTPLWIACLLVCGAAGAALYHLWRIFWCSWWITK